MEIQYSIVSWKLLDKFYIEQIHIVSIVKVNPCHQNLKKRFSVLQGETGGGNKLLQIKPNWKTRCLAKRVKNPSLIHP